MNRLVQNLPLAPDEAEKTKEAESLTTEDTSVEYDLVSITSADNVTERIELSGGNSLAVGVQATRVLSPRDEFSRHTDVKQVAKEISRYDHSEFIKGVLIYSLQLLLAHRLGVCITRQVQETHRLTDMLIGSLSMSVVTMMLLMSPAFLGNARLLTLRGYRTNERFTFISDPSDPWEKFFAISLLSLMVPWLRLLFSFYA